MVKSRQTPSGTCYPVRYAYRKTRRGSGLFSAAEHAFEAVFQLRPHTRAVLVFGPFLEVLFARAAVRRVSLLLLGPPFTSPALLLFFPLALVHDKHASRAPLQAWSVRDARVPHTGGRYGVERRLGFARSV